MARTTLVLLLAKENLVFLGQSHLYCSADCRPQVQRPAGAAPAQDLKTRLRPAIILRKAEKSG